MTRIHRGTTEVEPLLVTGYEMSRESGNTLSRIIDRANGSPDVAFGPASLRKGTLEVLLSHFAVAKQLEALVTAPGPLGLTDGDLPGINMIFVCQAG